MTTIARVEWGRSRLTIYWRAPPATTQDALALDAAGRIPTNRFPPGPFEYAPTWAWTRRPLPSPQWSSLCCLSGCHRGRAANSKWRWPCPVAAPEGYGQELCPSLGGSGDREGGSPPSVDRRLSGPRVSKDATDLPPAPLSPLLAKASAQFEHAILHRCQSTGHPFCCPERSESSKISTPSKNMRIEKRKAGFPARSGRY